MNIVHTVNCQQLYEELWENNEEEEYADESADPAKSGPSESKSRISRREADKVVVPPWPKSP